MNEPFRKFSARVSNVVGSAHSFFLAVLLVALWAITGPLFDYSTTWQLIINTGTTIITFLMVFIIQNTQNRDSKAMKLQLDEIIQSNRKASSQFLDLDDMSDAELDALRQHFKDMHQKLEQHTQKRATQKTR